MPDWTGIKLSRGRESFPEPADDLLARTFVHSLGRLLVDIEDQAGKLIVPVEATGAFCSAANRATDLARRSARKCKHAVECRLDDEQASIQLLKPVREAINSVLLAIGQKNLREPDLRVPQSLEQGFAVDRDTAPKAFAKLADASANQTLLEAHSLEPRLENDQIRG